MHFSPLLLAGLAIFVSQVASHPGLVKRQGPCLAVCYKSADECAPGMIAEQHGDCWSCCSSGNRTPGAELAVPKGDQDDEGGEEN
ncbi:hypothetical protein FQN54_006779 [Arachnomyces sp. PD_36]|nr:hypothetical protein FQN54_006779 [Arachnomyces sp. PD_36]